MKKLLYILFGFLFICNAYAAQIVNVEYIHNLISQEWDITVPYNPALTNVKTIANMKYLLTAVDVANEILNGEKTSNYGNTEFATTRIADTTATIQAVETLVRKINNITPAPEDAEYKFFLTTTPDTDSFSFRIIAAGEFYIDWGDGKTQLITKNDVEYTDYSYKYKKTGTYTIKLGGIATGYIMEDEYVEPAINFSSSASKIASIDGSLGAIFGTLSDGTVPKFSGMFSGAVNLSSISANLFSGVNGTQEDMFAYTFSGCSGLTSIPDGLFAGISGAPAMSMFDSTFYGCSGLTSIPENLFAGISGAPAEGMFSATFAGCSGLTSIPSDLFAGISGAPASFMFENTFYGCESLTYIPANLFAGVSGIISAGMFYGTFADCTSLRTIPEELFASLDGGDDMYKGGYAFAATFAGSGIESIPENLFGNIASSLPGGIFMQTFAYCPNLTGPSARINGVYLYNIWPDATEEEVYGMYEGSTGLDDYACIPYAWGGGGEECDSSSSTPSVPEDAVYDFYLTTTSDTDVFAMQISAAGEFYIDWGDGTVETITKSDTTDTTYSHKYTTAGAYTIGLGGQATAYNTDIYTGAINFYVGSNTSAKETNVKKIASIDGSLGAIFGTLANGAQPRFYYTFYDAIRMKGSIPSDLFAGISGKPASYMFESTFYGCSALTSIPSDLFAGISGAPAERMFANTFSNCIGLTSIPAGLFGNLTGAPAWSMFESTFENCSGLTSIPDGLFAGIYGAPATSMFYGTFSGCSGLTSIPENLFGNISGTTQYQMFSRTFYNCTSLTGPSARINGKYLYEIWPNETNDEVGAMYSGATGLDDYRCIPTAWGGGGENCSAPTAEFTLTTTPDTSVFGLSISAAGEFVVDWGDGTVETITKPDTTDTTYTHNYSTADEYTIGLSGQATAYTTNEFTAVISFYKNSSQTKIASIDGSLGAIFGTLSSDTNNQPRFYWTFYNAYNMTGSIPSDLFAGISGAPASNMFQYTFSGCSGLTGAIPDGLFGNLTGAPASNMFSSTFSGCRGLTSIPENLFGNISGTAQDSMFYSTFANCTSLTGPSARINGKYLYEIWPNFNFDMNYGPYYGCTGLSDYSTMPAVWRSFND